MVAILAALFVGENTAFLGAAGLVLGVIGLLLLATNNMWMHNFYLVDKDGYLPQRKMLPKQLNVLPLSTLSEAPLSSTTVRPWTILTHAVRFVGELLTLHTSIDDPQATICIPYLGFVNRRLECSRFLGLKEMNNKCPSLHLHGVIKQVFSGVGHSPRSSLFPFASNKKRVRDSALIIREINQADSSQQTKDFL
ncbi:unnamed protein product [Prunus armeniaca]